MIVAMSEPGIGNSEPNEVDFPAELVEHAARCWDAERENASRLSARGTLFLTALAARFSGWVYIGWSSSAQRATLTD